MGCRQTGVNVNITRGTTKRAWKERRTRREWRTAYKDLRAHYRYLAMDIGRLLSVMYIYISGGLVLAVSRALPPPRPRELVEWPREFSVISGLDPPGPSKVSHLHLQ